MIKGLDISSHQSANYKPASDIDFVFVKATEGTTYVNPYRDQQIANARAAGCVVGHYHWLHHGSIDAQVAYFASNAGVKSGDILWLDFEQDGVTTAEKDDFLRKLKSRFPNNRVGLYTNYNYWINVDTSGYYGDSLWFAYYVSSLSTRPPIQANWTFWQHSQTPIDQNVAVFNSKTQLKDWASGKASAVVIDRRAKVAFRGGWTCGCVATSLPLVEQDMIKRGLIKESIDIWQLGYRGDVEASAGTHNKGGCTDVDQYSDAQLQVWRDWGWTMQHRTPAQGFMHHAHGFPYGCTHMSAGAQYQITDWRNGMNGLTGAGYRAKVTGPGWQVINWEDALKRKAGTSGAAVAAADKAAKDDKEEDVARKRIAKSRSKVQKNVTAGDWQPIWVVNDQERTVATGPCEADFGVNLRVQGVTEGEAVYVRAVSYDIVNGVPVRNKNSDSNIQELDGQKGDMWGPALTFSCVVGGPAKKKGHSSRRLLLEWMCNDPKAVIKTVEITGWSVQK